MLGWGPGFEAARAGVRAASVSDEACEELLRDIKEKRFLKKTAQFKCMVISSCHPVTSAAQ